MRAYFLLICLQILAVTRAIAAIAKKDPIALEIGKNTYITYQDFDQLKAMIAVPVATWLLKEAWEFYKKKTDRSEQEDKEFKKEVLEKLTILSTEVHDLRISVAGLDSSKANTDQVQEIVRTELEFIERFRK